LPANARAKIDELKLLQELWELLRATPWVYGGTNDQVRLGISAPQSVVIRRGELPPPIFDVELDDLHSFDESPEPADTAA
jgi:hypothetical protein